MSYSGRSLAEGGGSPAAQGYRMPAEWERHESVWLSWPCNTETFPGRIEEVERTYCTVIAALAGGERIDLLVRDARMRRRVEELLERAGGVVGAVADAGAVHYHLYDYGDVWFRDYGPTFLVNAEGKRLAMVDWLFNAWGGKYEELIQDTSIPAFMNRSLSLPLFTPSIVLEGGSIDVNGAGTLLTTEECLLNRNRNPSLTREEIEERLRDYLGVRKIIWLKSGIGGDDTDGHIDDIARFVAPSTVLCAYEANESDENHAPLRENYEILLRATDQDGRGVEVKKVPMPPAIRSEGRRLPASYTNFYIGNRAVLVPLFGCDTDEEALAIIGPLFPGREIVGIDCRDLVFGCGALHCISQQQPAL